MRTKRTISKYLAAARNMPPLPHRNEPFQIAKSKVVQWLAGNADVLQWLFSTVVSKRLIVFDPASKKWSGADFNAAINSVAE